MTNEHPTNRPDNERNEPVSFEEDNRFDNETQNTEARRDSGRRDAETAVDREATRERLSEPVSARPAHSHSHHEGSRHSEGSRTFEHRSHDEGGSRMGRLSRHGSTFALVATLFGGLGIGGLAGAALNDHFDDNRGGFSHSEKRGERHGHEHGPGGHRGGSQDARGGYDRPMNRDAQGGAQNGAQGRTDGAAPGVVPGPQQGQNVPQAPQGDAKQGANGNNSSAESDNAALVRPDGSSHSYVIPGATVDNQGSVTARQASSHSY